MAVPPGAGGRCRGRAAGLDRGGRRGLATPGDRERVAAVLALSERVRERLAAWAPAIPAAVVDGFRTGGEDSSFGGDLDTDVLLRFGDAFDGLLRGEIEGEGFLAVY
ncbi:hypothetical protein [Kitasatospora sp. NPDC088346]|uniref:hypothetical protein n=1 Tax=Kitasatospora sp. NPDC088346 TaxID=3364073 RepID=UPI0038020441